VHHFLTNGFFGFYSDYRSYRILGVATAAGEEVKAEAPGSVIYKDFDKSYRKVSRWNVTIPEIKQNVLSKIVKKETLYMFSLVSSL
jgi:hypothetical protein